MPSLIARLTPTRGLRAPRPTARLRLTLLYGTLFLLSGAVLLAVTYVLAAHTTAITLPGGKPDTESATARNCASGAVVVRAGDAVTCAPRRRPSDGLRSPHARGRRQSGLGAASSTASKSTSAPRTPSAGGNGVVHLTSTQSAHLQAQVTHLHDAAMHRLLIRSGLTFGVMAVISIALGWLMAGRVLRPVRRINTAARQIGASNLHERLSLDGPDDEFRDLAGTLDDLLERLQGSFDSQRRFVANASHELRTPLTLDRALLERALRKLEPTQAFWRDTCERLLASSQHQDGLIEALLTLARSEGALDRSEPYELGAVIDSVLLSPELDTRSAGLQIQTHIDPAPVTGDPRLLERLVHNLIDNAIRHNIPGGHVEITTGTRDRHAFVFITNSGPTVPPEEMPRLLQPFQRLNGTRTNHASGNGLGLAIVDAIAAAHRATLTTQARSGGGLIVEVTFPATAVDAKQTNATTRQPAVQAGAQT